MEKNRPIVPASVTAFAALENALCEDYYLISIEEPLYTQITEDLQAAARRWLPDWEPVVYADKRFILLKRRMGRCVFDEEKHTVNYLWE